MPTSVPYAIPIVAGVARQLRPRSVLDVGTGFGKYGFILREFTDIWDMGVVGDYDRARWRTRIEGIDATPQYITPLHRYLYDRIHVGDVRALIDTLPGYDLIIMGDLLEHFEKEEGHALIDKLLARAGRCLLLIFPHRCALNPHVLDNPLEAHRSSWSRGDFRRFPHRAVRILENYSCLVALAHDRRNLPILRAHFGARRRRGWKQPVADWVARVFGAPLASRLASVMLRRKVSI